MKNAKVLVLGCGPAGLFAAHAAALSGHDVIIYSKKRRSHMYGAQYLHYPIPGLRHDNKSFMVDYRLEGETWEYAEKVYGDSVPFEVSPEKYLGLQPAWNIREAYAVVWELYEGRIIYLTVEPEFMQTFINSFDLVINTIPSDRFCKDTERHTFRYRNVWAIGDAPDKGQLAPKLAPLNTVICNGEGDVGWYRASNIDGWCTVEWPEDRKPPIEGVVSVTKPIDNNCDCWDDTGKYWRAGRFGLWRKDVLAHHAYWWTFEAFKAVAEW